MYSPFKTPGQNEKYRDHGYLHGIFNFSLFDQLLPSKEYDPKVSRSICHRSEIEYEYE